MSVCICVFAHNYMCVSMCQCVYVCVVIGYICPIIFSHLMPELIRRGTNVFSN